MNPVQDSPDALDAAIQAVLKDGAIPKDAGEIIPGTHQVLEDLAILAEATPTRASFINQLETQLLRLPTQPPGSSHPQQLPQEGPARWLVAWWPGRRTRTGRSWSLSLALSAAGLAVILLVSALWSGRAPTASAEVLARAGQVAEDPTALGLHSYTGVIVGQDRSAAVAPLVQWRQESWFAAPSSRRIEFHVTGITPAPQGQAPGSSPLPDQILVSDGTDAWAFDPTMQHVAIIDPGVLTLTSIGGGATNLDALLRQAGQNYTATVSGSEQVAGRITWVLDLTPKAGTPAAKIAAHMKAWIDQETYLQLRAEGWDAQGQLLFSWAFTSLQINPPLDAKLFHFTPPPGAQVVWRRAPRPDELQQQWQQIGQQAPFHVFVPTAVPGRFTPQVPRYDSAQGPVVEQNYQYQAELQALVIRERVPASIEQRGTPEDIQIGTWVGQYYPGLRSGLLVLDLDGTQILLEGSAVSKEELIQVAGSLQPVAPTAVPSP